MIAPNVILIHRNMIIGKLRACGARSESTAVTLAEAGVRNPGAHSRGAPGIRIYHREARKDRII